MTIDERWAIFVTAALRREMSPESAAAIADQLEAQYQKRFGYAAQILQGIHNCYMCKKEIGNEEYVATDGKDGEFKKFCIDCVKRTVPGLLEDPAPSKQQELSYDSSPFPIVNTSIIEVVKEEKKDK